MKDIFLYIDAICVFSILIGLAVIIFYNLIDIVGYPTKRIRREIIERLPSYMMDAEKLYGRKTGEIKLAYVYDRFCKDYPQVKKWVNINYMNGLVCHGMPTINSLLNNKSSEVL